MVCLKLLIIKIHLSFHLNLRYLLRYLKYVKCSDFEPINNENINIRFWNHIFMSYVYPFLLCIYVKHTTFVWHHVWGCWLLVLLINGILDICVNNQSQGYGVFKLNFRDILNYFMLLITGIQDICVKTSEDTGYLTSSK